MEHKQEQSPSTPNPTAYRVIRAHYTPTTITVYQAYNPAIADAAVKAQTLVAPFRRTRMTWIKPSFLWMAYRSGYASKPSQERVLAIEITRAGFEWALRNSCLSHLSKDKLPQQQDDSRTEGSEGSKAMETWKEKLRASPVRIQWDPERDFAFRALNHRSIQIGVSGEAVDRYVDEWIVGVRDVTGVMRRVKELVDAGREEEARALLPDESVYPLSEELRDILKAS